MKTTKKDFEIYKTEVHKWIEILSLKDWDLWFIHENLLKKEEMGSCSTSYRGRKATFRLTTHLPRDFSKYGKSIIEIVKNTALHEVLELMLTRLYALAEARDWDESEWEAETHAIINRLQKTLK